MGENTRIIFEELCPNCGGSIDDIKLKTIGVCGECLPTPAYNLSSSNIAEALRRTKKLRGYRIIAEVEEFMEKFREIFTKSTGFKPWALQEVWARRVFLKENFTLNRKILVTLVVPQDYSFPSILVVLNSSNL